MWCVEIRADKDLLPVKKYLLGTSARITIGRKVDCNISFPNDKSVSRNHAELRLLENGFWSIIDLNSKFSTFILSGTAQSKVPVSMDAVNVINTPVDPGDEIQIGACNSKVLITRVCFRFCPTKLDKAEKVHLKDLLREPISCGISSIGSSTFSAIATAIETSGFPSGTVVQDIVVASKFSATVKILEALVAKCTIVNLQYVALFAESVKAAATRPGALIDLPLPGPHFPALSHAAPIDLSLDRRALFLEHFVYLPRPQTDAKYSALLEACGAYVVPVSTAIATAASDDPLRELHARALQDKWTSYQGRIVGEGAATRRLTSSSELKCAVFVDGALADASDEANRLMTTLSLQPLLVAGMASAVIHGGSGASSGLAPSQSQGLGQPHYCITQSQVVGSFAATQPISQSVSSTPLPPTAQPVSKVSAALVPVRPATPPPLAHVSMAAPAVVDNPATTALPAAALADSSVGDTPLCKRMRALVPEAEVADPAAVCAPGDWIYPQGSLDRDTADATSPDPDPASASVSSPASGEGAKTKRVRGEEACFPGGNSPRGGRLARVAVEATSTPADLLVPQTCASAAALTPMSADFSGSAGVGAALALGPRTDCVLVDDGDGWLVLDRTATRHSQGGVAATVKPESLVGSDSQQSQGLSYGGTAPAATVEMDIIKTERTADRDLLERAQLSGAGASGRVTPSAATTESGVGTGRLRDVRRFRKNFVRHTAGGGGGGDAALALTTASSLPPFSGLRGSVVGAAVPVRVVLYSLATMEKVYPKETERDAQLRLEATENIGEAAEEAASSGRGRRSHRHGLCSSSAPAAVGPSFADRFGQEAFG